ncbi:hypothetical protein SAMN05428967_4032 [Phyllobacterium sp. YR620]|uniref:DUF5691 domain-containing protein n=1 Tax=Phyllobacterium sp. YR620 TaxID=1881066 RepID=UPI000891673D|nr:DUF5691 domain-containing protein [Phyllobacterium sp. YR620]SDP87942.1 hypothetical protein SAMN05428967_4032 [Phyllobacterium sp. YR620]
MNVSSLTDVIVPRLLSGAKDGLPLDAAGVSDALQALALAGQAMRFERPLSPEQFDAGIPVVDHATIVPDAARKLLLRLLTPKNQASSRLTAAIVRKLTERRLRLHPFDLPKLETMVRAYAEHLGAEALAFSQREVPVTQQQNYFAPDSLHDSNWMHATPAVKAGYIQERRKSDPEAARGLVTTAWQAESAESRVRLLEALRENLSEADAPFLKGLDKDRAPRVRDLAARLLVRLPAFEGDDPPLRAALECIKVTKSGILFKKKSLTLELPATVRENTVMAWLNETFGPVGLDKLANALSLSVEAMVAAAKQDELLVAFLLMATQDKRLDIVKLISDGHLHASWEPFMRLEADLLAQYPPEMRQVWAAYIFRPDRWTNDTARWIIGQLARFLGGEATQALFSDLLRSKQWQSFGNEKTYLDADIAASMAIMCPAPMRSLLRTQLAAFDPAECGNAILFLDLMDKLETIDV